MIAMLTHYALLNISEEATQNEIDKAYLKLEVKTIEVQNAYLILKDPEKKQNYDDWLKVAPKDGHFFSPSGSASTPRPLQKRLSIYNLRKQSSMPNLKDNQIVSNPIDEVVTDTKEKVDLSVKMLVAAIEQQWEQVELCLTQDAYIESYLTPALCKQLKQPLVYCQYTVLHLAILDKTCDIQLIKRLIEKGANVNSSTRSGITPLHIAAYQGNLEITQFLLEHGALAHKISKEKDTPLHIALEREHLAVALKLIQNPSEPSLPFFHKKSNVNHSNIRINCKKQTPFNIAFSLAIDNHQKTNENAEPKVYFQPNSPGKKLDYWDIVESLLHSPKVKLKENNYEDLKHQAKNKKVLIPDEIMRLCEQKIQETKASKQPLMQKIGSILTR